MREIPLESLETAAQATLEKVNRAMAEGYFHYARALAFGLLDQYPHCPALRQIIRQATVASGQESKNNLLACVKIFFTGLFYIGRTTSLPFLNALENILAEHPDSLCAHRLFASVALKKEFYQSAAFSLESIMILAPSRVHTQITLSRIYLKMGRVEEAQQIVQQIIARSPNNSFAEELLKETSVARTLRSDQWNAR